MNLLKGEDYRKTEVKLFLTEWNRSISYVNIACSLAYNNNKITKNNNKIIKNYLVFWLESYPFYIKKIFLTS